MTLTPKPPAYSPAQARAMRALRKTRATMAKNPRLGPARLTDERRYEHAKGGN